MAARKEKIKVEYEKYRDVGNAVAFRPDGKVLAMGGANKSVKVCGADDKTQTLVGTHKEEVTSLAFSPGGKLLASGSKDETTRLWALGPDK